MVGPRLGQCSYSNPDCASCSLDGFSANCAEVHRLIDAGAAQQCEGNDCGPKTKIWSNDDGHTFTFLSTPFMAFTNGVSGYFLSGWAEAGTAQEQADAEAMRMRGDSPTGIDMPRRQGQTANHFLPQEPIPLPDVPAELDKLLKAGKCGEFVKNLIEKVASKDNPAINTDPRALLKDVTIVCEVRCGQADGQTS